MSQDLKFHAIGAAVHSVEQRTTSTGTGITEVTIYGYEGKHDNGERRDSTFMRIAFFPPQHNGPDPSADILAAGIGKGDHVDITGTIGHYKRDTPDGKTHTVHTYRGQTCARSVKWAARNNAPRQVDQTPHAAGQPQASYSYDEEPF